MTQGGLGDWSFSTNKGQGTWGAFVLVGTGLQGSPHSASSGSARPYPETWVPVLCGLQSTSRSGDSNSSPRVEAASYLSLYPSVLFCFFRLLTSVTDFLYQIPSVEIPSVVSVFLTGSRWKKNAHESLLCRGVSLETQGRWECG